MSPKPTSTGKDEILKGLDQGVFYREEDGSVWVDLEPIKLDKKVLLRKDGTSLYMTQDVWGLQSCDTRTGRLIRVIYVVAMSSSINFRVLFYVLEKLGYEWRVTCTISPTAWSICRMEKMKRGRGRSSMPTSWSIP
jgi:arginyl-tRNA synthetase